MAGPGERLMLCKLKACWKCAGDLVLDGDEWRCWQCGRYYPQLSGVELQAIAEGKNRHSGGSESAPNDYASPSAFGASKLGWSSDSRQG